jgi:hypothetical protein
VCSPSSKFCALKLPRTLKAFWYNLLLDECQIHNFHPSRRQRRKAEVFTLVIAIKCELPRAVYELEKAPAALGEWRTRFNIYIVRYWRSCLPAHVQKGTKLFTGVIIAGLSSH